MGRADFRRRKQSRRNAVAQAFQVPNDDLEVASEIESGHVLAKDDGGSYLIDDAGEVVPKPALAIGSGAPAGDGHFLARVARSDDIHDATPRSAIEGDKVVPDRSRIQGRVRHPRHERRRGVGFPLDVTHSSISWLSDVNAEVESASAGT